LWTLFVRLERLLNLSRPASPMWITYCTQWPGPCHLLRVCKSCVSLFTVKQAASRGWAHLCMSCCTTAAENQLSISLVPQDCPSPLRDANWHELNFSYNPQPTGTLWEVHNVQCQHSASCSPVVVTIFCKNGEAGWDYNYSASKTRCSIKDWHWRQTGT
jgi:hypothetical protein